MHRLDFGAKKGLNDTFKELVDVNLFFTPCMEWCLSYASHLTKRHLGLQYMVGYLHLQARILHVHLLLLSFIIDTIH